MALRTKANVTMPEHWGVYILQWMVIVLLPLFLLFCVGLAIFELYCKFATTFAKRKRVQHLLDSLRLPSNRRTFTDIRIIVKFIRGSKFLEAYPSWSLSRLGRTCELLELKPKEAVIRQGDVACYFYVLIKGTVDVYASDVSSPQHLKCVNSFHDSGSFGELALMQVRSVGSALPIFQCGCVAAAAILAGCLLFSGRRQAYCLYRMQNGVQTHQNPR